MNIQLSAIIDAAKTTSVVFIPSLLGYLLAAPASLRVWLAVQKLPVFDGKSEPISRKRAALTTIAAVLVMLGLEGTLFLYTNPTVLQAILVGFFAFGYAISTISCFHGLAQITPSSMHRNNLGAPISLHVQRQRGGNHTRAQIGISLAAVVVTAGAFLTDSFTLPIILCTAGVYNLSRSTGWTTVSMRAMIIMMLSMIGLSIIITVPLVFVLMRMSPREPEAASSTSTMGLATTLNELLESRRWLMVPLYVYFSGLMISLSLRFDYQRYLDTSETTCELVLPTVPAPEPPTGKAPQYGEGVCVPSKAPTAFPKAYYCTALAAWALGHLALTCVSAFTAWDFAAAPGFASVAQFIELPLISFALMAVALIRGEWKAFWTYREVWTVVPTPQNIVPRGDAEVEKSESK